MKRYRIAIYLRLSVEDMDVCSTAAKQESYSISNQRSYIKNYLDKKPEFQNAIVREFVDDGYSGTNFERPAVKKMLSLCRQNEFDCIVVKDLSRFGRNYLEVGDYLEQIFPFLGIRFIGINDGFDSKNFSGKTGGMDVAFKNFIYEMYSRDLSEKIKSGVQTCMKRGEYFAGYIVYGYKKKDDGKNIIVDEPAARVIRRIFKEMSEGKGAKQIAIELNAEGIPTRLAYKQAKGEHSNRHNKSNIWDRYKILSIVRNEVYQGDLVYAKYRIVKKNHHEPIVSRELFRLANENTREVRQTEYDRTGVKKGVVFCGCCGKRMELRKTKNAFYLCKRRNLLENVECNLLRIERKVIEELVWGVWQEYCRLFEAGEVREAIGNKMIKMQSRQRLLHAQIEQIPARKVKLYEGFKEKSINENKFLKEKETLANKEKAVRQAMEKTSEQLEKYKQILKNCKSITSLVEKEVFMQVVVDKIIVYNEKRIEVVWLYRDKLKEILLVLT